MAIPKKMIRLLTKYRDTYGRFYWDQGQGLWGAEEESGKIYKKAEEALLKYLRGYCSRSKSPQKVKPIPTFDEGIQS